MFDVVDLFLCSSTRLIPRDINWWKSYLFAFVKTMAELFQMSISIKLYRMMRHISNHLIDCLTQCQTMIPGVWQQAIIIIGLNVLNHPYWNLQWIQLLKLSNHCPASTPSTYCKCYFFSVLHKLQHLDSLKGCQNFAITYQNPANLCISHYLEVRLYVVGVNDIPTYCSLYQITLYLVLSTPSSHNHISDYQTNTGL